MESQQHQDASDDNIPNQLSVLPVQFIQQHSQETGALRLAKAVVEMALHDVIAFKATAGRRARRMSCDAESWFFSDDTDWPYSFLNLCDSLNIDVAAFRRQYLATYSPLGPHEEKTDSQADGQKETDSAAANSHGR
jgi:hypothetical protein